MRDVGGYALRLVLPYEDCGMKRHKSAKDSQNAKLP